MIFRPLAVTTLAALSCACVATNASNNGAEQGVSARTMVAAAPGTFLPPPPSMTLEQVMQRCRTLFGEKVTYIGKTNEGRKTTNVFNTDGGYFFGGVSNRFLCRVNVSWWNTRQEGFRDVLYGFDGVSVIWIEPKHNDPNYGSVLTFSEDGSMYTLRRQHLNDDKTLRITWGTYRRE